MVGSPSRPLMLALLLVAGGLSGCFGAYDQYDAFDPDPEYKNPGVFNGTYNFGSPSTVLRPGLLEKGDPEIVQLRSTLPAYAGQSAEGLSEATVLIVMAIWRPQNHTQPVPVIIDAGPYYEQGSRCRVPRQDPCTAGMVNDTIATEGQSTPLGLQNFLPHGYAIVQLAVRGTGTAGGCMDLLGPAEKHDLDQAITWLAEQPWSNGNVAMIGTSYDGSTPWEVAAMGNPALKTIVPISGLPDIYDLMFHNGSAEVRGTVMHDGVYWNYGFSDDFGQPPPLPPTEPPLPIPPVPHFHLGNANGREDYQNLQNLVCPEVYEGAAMGRYTYATGARGGEFSTYWQERDHRQAVLDNYKGSVFLIHGLQDWNVDPHAAIPFNTQLRAAGIEMKEWYGQWDHATPDSRCIQRSEPWVTLPCRLDWAEVLLRWFDRYLKGNTTNDIGPSVQVQDSIGYWRNAEAFPPTAPRWTDLPLNADGTFTAGSGEFDLTPGTPTTPGTVLELRSDILTEDLRFSGLPQVKLPFEAQGPGGQVAVWLFDEDAEGNVRAPMAACDRRGQCEPAGIPIVGHGQMNLRYHAGGEEPQSMVPGTRYVAQMELEPLDVMIPRGHRLVAWIFQGQYPDHAATATPSTIKLILDGDAKLRLPVVDVDPTTIFPVPGVHVPDRELYFRMHVAPPPFAPTDLVAPPILVVPPAEEHSGPSPDCVPGAVALACRS